MNEREELLMKFQKAMPLVEELSKKENKFVKCTKTKGTLAKVIVVVVGLLIIAFIPYMCFGKLGEFIMGSIPFDVFLAVMIWLSVVNKKKMNENDAGIQKILNSDELSFIPVSYLNSFDIIGIYKVLLDMRADTFKEAINVWEQDKHNMVMEAKPAVIVK